jgi:hypothetical protein
VLKSTLLLITKTNTAMKIKKNVAISESGFIFNPTTGDSFSTNPIGLEIIRMLKDDKSKDDIRKSILGKYITDESTFEKDYYDFVNMLQSNQVADDSE